MKKQADRIISLLISVVMISTSFSFAENTVQQASINYEGFMANEIQEMKVYYDDSYWTGSSAKYNEHLASLSMALALTGYDEKSGNTVKALEAIGCSNVKNKEYKVATENVVAAVMGSKKLSDGTTLIPVIVRGTKTNMIWAKNIQLGSKGEATGFKTAANRTYSYVTSYVKTLKTKKIKIWIMGHSRYGAIANLTAKKLNSQYGKDKVFAYCFENPMTAIKNSKNARMTNIHNVRDLDSGITKMAPSYMNFSVYGNWDKSFAVKDGNETKMKEMLAKINKNASTYKSPTTCKWASLDLKGLGSLDSLDVNSLCVAGQSVSQEELWNLFIARLKTMAGSRKAYALNKSSKSIEAAKKFGYKKSEVYTIEEALQNGIKLGVNLAGNSKKTQELNQEVLKSMTDGVDLSNLNGFTPDAIKLAATPIGKMLAGVILSNKLTPSSIIGTSKKEYAKYVSDFWKSTGLEKSKKISNKQKKQIKLIISTMMEPFLKVLAKDFDGDKEQELLISLLYNINGLMQAHYPEVTMAWLMTEDSNYTGE